MRYVITLGQREVVVELGDANASSKSPKGLGPRRAVIDGVVHEVDVLSVDPWVIRARDGRIIDLVTGAHAASREVPFTALGSRGVATVEIARSESAFVARSGLSEGEKGSARSGVLTSPMAGRVARVLVEVGAVVAKGEPLAVVEAMKMENELGAPRAGTVSEVRVRPGETIEAGAVMIVLS